MSIFNPSNSAKDRVLVSTDPKDPARWLKKPVQGPAYVTKENYGWIDEYKRIFTAEDVKTAIPGKKIQQVEQYLSRLLEDSGEDMERLTGTQIRGAAQVLAGAFGPEVTLTGLDPTLAQIIQDNLGNMQEDLPGVIKVDPDKLNLNTLDDHPSYFLVSDGMITPEDWEIDKGYGTHNRDVDDLTEEELLEKDQEVKEVWNISHPDVIQQRKVKPSIEEIQEAQEHADQLDKHKKKKFKLKNPFSKSKKKKKDIEPMSMPERDDL